MGVDGVYRMLGGGYAAYQVKFRTGRKSQTWSELSTFIGLADRADLKVLFTNSDEVRDVVSERTGFFCIRGADLDRLTKDDFDVIDNWLQGSLVRPTLKTPRPHQAEALDATLDAHLSASNLRPNKTASPPLAPGARPPARAHPPIHHHGTRRSATAGAAARREG